MTAALAFRGLDGGWEVSVLGCDDARITALNAGFRGRAAATNVLAWPSAERAAEVAGTVPPPPRPGAGEDRFLGDIAIADGVCAAEAAAAGLDLGDHAVHLLVHATLHLLGYDHDDDRDAQAMERDEAAILGRLGIPDPRATR